MKSNKSCFSPFSHVPTVDKASTVEGSIRVRELLDQRRKHLTTFLFVAFSLSVLYIVCSSF